MKKQIIIGVLILGFITAMTASVKAQQWSIKGDYAESCNCNAPCPCHFGSPSSHGVCEGSGLLEIKEGFYGDVNLDGISVVTTLHVGEWIKYYVSENATDEQVKTIGPLIQALIGYPAEWKVLSIDKVPISVERTATKVKFSVPTSTVEIEIMKGQNGEPIRIQNLPAGYLSDLTQYKSITNSHNSEDKKFSYSGTNGLTSKVNTGSKK